MPCPKNAWENCTIPGFGDAKHIRNGRSSEDCSETLFVHLTGKIVGMVQIQDIMKDQRTWLFLGGVAVGAAAVTILGSKAARDLAVAGLAQGMKMRDDAEAALSSIKEDAEDVYVQKFRVPDDDDDAECPSAEVKKIEM